MEKKEALELLAEIFKLELKNEFQLIEDCIILNFNNGEKVRITLKEMAN